MASTHGISVPLGVLLMCMCVQQHFGASIRSHSSHTWVGVLASYPAPNNRAPVFRHFFGPPFLLTPTQLSTLGISLKRRHCRTCPPPLPLPPWVMHWSIINSFISIFSPSEVLVYIVQTTAWMLTSLNKRTSWILSMTKAEVGRRR